MCTISKGPFVPEKDLTVFKTFIKNGDWLISPFHHYTWSVGETHETLFRHPIYRDAGEDRKQLLHGCFHSYEYVTDARLLGEDIVQTAHDAGRPLEVAVCRCTIPKRSEFVYRAVCTNWRRREAPAYASEQLKVEEILEVLQIAE